MKNAIPCLLLAGILLCCQACIAISVERPIRENKTNITKGMTYTYKCGTTDKRFKVQADSGRVIFDGPVNTIAERAMVPHPHDDVLRRLEGTH